MEERRLQAEPILPPKPATKGYLKAFIPPKLQFKKNGEFDLATGCVVNRDPRVLIHGRDILTVSQSRYC